MCKKNEDKICLIPFILSVWVNATFFFILYLLSVMMLWIIIPVPIILGFTIVVFFSLFGILFVLTRRKQLRWLKAIALGGISSTTLLLVLLLIFPLRIKDPNSERLTNRQQNLVSPSGKYILTVPVKRIKQKSLSFGSPFLIVTISDPNGNVIYQDEEQTFPAWFGTYWMWDQQDRMWIFGSDAGTYFYDNINGNWIKNDLSEDLGIVPPESLYPESIKKGWDKPGRELIGWRLHHHNVVDNI